MSIISLLQKTFWMPPPESTWVSTVPTQVPDLSKEVKELTKKVSEMDKKIKKIEKDVKKGKNKKAVVELKSLEKADKKRDKLVDMGKKEMHKK